MIEQASAMDNYNGTRGHYAEAGAMHKAVNGWEAVL
jgi:hypothetical protein